MHTLKFDEMLCTNCQTSDCLVKCQYMQMDRGEARREMIKIAKGEDSSVLRDCVTCYACEEYCPFGNHPFYRITEGREDKGMLTASRPITNQWINMLEFQGQYQVGEIKEKAISFCIMDELKQAANGKLFGDLSSSYIIGPEFFCQAVYLHFAKTSITKKRLPTVIEHIQRLGIKQLVCVHDECYGTFASLAPAYGIEVPFEPIHYLEYLFEKLTDLKDQIKPLGIRAVYQRPCSSRLSSDKHRFVNKIFDLIGVELVQRQYQEENALCCGGLFRDVTEAGLAMANDVQKRNLDDMEHSGAEYCVLSCPFCQMVLSEKIAKRGMKPIHMIDLCKMAIGEKQTGEVE